MGKQAAKATMMRFEPQSGWSEASGQVIPINESINESINTGEPSSESTELLSADALVNLGDSMQEVFDSLKINDPRLQAWTQVHAAIRLIGGKLQEKKSLQERLAAIDLEIEGVRNLASELVGNAYRSEQELHETSRLRMQIAESLHEKLSSALKT